MKKKSLTRRDFLKLTGVGTAIVVPGILGYDVFRSAQGEYPIEGSPYKENLATTNLDGSVPILLVVSKDSANPFGIYLGEILRAEGLNSFHTVDLSNIQAESLENYGVVVLAETLLNTSQAEMFESYVARGGRLVGMKPDDRLGAVFGLEKREGSISDGYVKIDSSHPVSEGISPSTLQFHGPSNLYRLAGAQAVAWLYSDRDSPSEYPAITQNSYQVGRAVLWAFDLSTSIVFTRQGNPAFSNQDRDGHPFIRPTDMFTGWVDLERIAIPQADEQQRLFVKLIYELTKDLIPIPRLWYFPGNVNALLVATGDAHPISGASAIEDVLTRVERRNGHMSIYYSFTLHDDLYRFAQRGRFYASKLPIAGNMLVAGYKTPTPDQVSDWRARGHEFTLHPHVGTDICGGFGVDSFVTFDSLEDGWQTYWRQFTGLGYGPVFPTVRTHCVLWKGWTETARLQASYGIRMNLDYYHVGPAFTKKNGERVYGHFTGSGLPMMFIDEQGRVLNLYQQLTQLADEHFFSFPEINWVEVGDYTAEAALDISKGLLQSSLANGFPTAFCANFHPDPFAYGGRPAEIAGRWLDGTLDYAVENGIPIWSAHDWLRFTQMRYDTKILSLIWNENGYYLDFVVEVKPEANINAGNELALMIPSEYKDLHLAVVELNGLSLNASESLVGGIPFHWIPISVGSHRIVARYS